LRFEAIFVGLISSGIYEKCRYNMRFFVAVRRKKE
jgi:hypothetical protein